MPFACCLGLPAVKSGIPVAKAGEELGVHWLLLRGFPLALLAETSRVLDRWFLSLPLPISAQAQTPGEGLVTRES